MGGSSYGKFDTRIYTELAAGSERGRHCGHPIDLCRYQVANCYMGRSPLLNSGGASSGANDLADAVRTAVINKRAGGVGLISGRKTFQKPDGRGRQAVPRHPGCLPRRQRHRRLTDQPHDPTTPDARRPPGGRLSFRAAAR
jgi:hypothetical protein